MGYYSDVYLLLKKNVSPSEALSYEWRYCDQCERAMPVTLMHSAVCCKACCGGG